MALAGCRRRRPGHHLSKNGRHPPTPHPTPTPTQPLGGIRKMPFHNAISLCVCVCGCVCVCVCNRDQIWPPPIEIDARRRARNNLVNRLLGFTEFYGVLPSFTEFDLVLPVFIGFYWV